MRPIRIGSRGLVTWSWGCGTRLFPLHNGGACLSWPEAGPRLDHLSCVLFGQHGIVKAHVLASVLVDAGVNQAGVLVALELVNGIVHEGAIEHVEADE